MSDQFPHDSGIPAVHNRDATLDERGYPTDITLEVRVPDGAGFQTYVVKFSCSVDGGDESAKIVKMWRKGGKRKHNEHWIDKSLAALFRAQRAIEEMGIEVSSLIEKAGSAKNQAYQGNSLICEECEERYSGRILEDESAGKSATDWCPNCGASASNVVPVYQYEHTRGGSSE